MALTKKQTKELRRVLSALEAGHHYIQDDRTVICMVRSHATTVHDRPGTPGDDRILMPVEKYGSNLVQLGTGIDMLASFIVDNGFKGS